MRRPRWTTRRIMAAVLTLALGLGLGLPAVRAASDRKPHTHFWFASPAELGMTAEEFRSSPICGSALARTSDFDPEPFPARYWRHLRGLPPPPCRESMTRLGETCTLRPSP